MIDNEEVFGQCTKLRVNVADIVMAMLIAVHTQYLFKYILGNIFFIVFPLQTFGCEDLLPRGIRIDK